MTGVNWFFVALARHARCGGGELRAWRSERETAEYLYQSTWDAEHEPHPDGLGIWAEDGRDIVFLLEYDTVTGSEHLPQLADKLPGYAGNARTNMAFQVPILFCFPTPRREQSARRALARVSESRGLQIATAALDPRLTCPAGPVWMTLHGGHGPMRLIDLDNVLPDPWRVARTHDERERRELAALTRQPDGIPAEEDEKAFGQWS